ncbi:DUF7059 domain-containing protein [Serinicoccus sediminis]|uniref:DUF7059 domain-containing protein n=1 Tax=Serinicoccus sediminis TaxID=2306021 RepID=UPI001EDDB40B|nr:class I SAM-dependent methyltransferase [Serinicoccus sediminis]
MAVAALHREQPLPAVRVTEGSSDPVAVLCRLFALGREVGRTQLDDALPRLGADGLLRLGLVVEHDGVLAAACDLRPYATEQESWWVVSDRSEMATGGPLPTDHVLGIGGASTTLASWAPRPRVERALDIGTGSGVQVLHLAGHAAYLVATDVSQRALAFARFTLALNGVDAQLRPGSLLEPVAGEQFDLVVSNPPFVITPRRTGVPLYEYRDGGRAGDSLVAGLVRDLRDHLRPGGVGQLLANWELRPGEDWTEHVRGWFEGTGLDGWVVQREEQDVADYAETWARDGGHQPGTAGFDDLYAAWLDDFAERGIERLGFGVVTVQRPGTEREPWLDLMDVRGPVASPMGPTVLTGLRARTWLAEHGDDDLLDTPWQVADDVTEVRTGRPGEPDPQVIQVRQGGGLGRAVRLDTLPAGLVGACDGELTARQLCSGLAVLTEHPVAEVEQAVLPTLRELVKDGLLR